MKITLNDIIKALYSDKDKNDKAKTKTDTTMYGKVLSINGDGTYNVQIAGGVVTCDRLVGAKVGDTVMVLVQKTGHPTVINTAGGDADALDALSGIQDLTDRADSGEFNGANIWTATADPTTPNYTFNISDLDGTLSYEPKVGDLIMSGVYRYTITSVGTTTVLAGDRVSLQGPSGGSGESIASVTEYYLATSASSGVTPSTAGWTTTIQTMTPTNQYLWNYEVVTGSLGTVITTTAPVIIGRYGQNGKGISSIVEHYLATSASSGVTRDTAGWTTTVQSTTNVNRYLWNYETINYTDNTSSNTDPCIIGTQGVDGSGMSQITTAMRSQTYATIQSWVGLQNDQWSGISSFEGNIGDTVLIAVQVTDKDNAVGYMRCIVKGYNPTTQILTTDNLDFMMGPTGQTGSQGVSITACKTQYYLSTSDQSATGGSWSDTPQPFVHGRYYWTRDYITFSDGQTGQSTAVYNAGLTDANETAWNANSVATGLNQYFWFKDGNTTEAGAHITEVPQSTFETTPSGGNVLVKSVGMYIRKGLSVFASYLEDGVRLFKNGTVGDNTTTLFASFLTSGARIYDGAGTLIAHLGYGEGNIESGAGTTDKPYYILGSPPNTSSVSDYNPTTEYSQGEWVKYDDKLYVYINQTASTGIPPTNTNYWTYYIGNYSLEQGWHTTAAGFASVAEGSGNIACGSSAHAEGYACKAYGEHSHAEGYYARSIGKQSHAEGSFSRAYGYAAHAEGHNNNAIGNESHATGEWNDAGYNDQFVCGKFSNNKANDLFEVGNGTGLLDRHNAFEVDQSGHAKFNELAPFKKYTASGSSGSVASGSYAAVSLTGTIPAGYTPIAIQSISSNHNNLGAITRWTLNSNGTVSVTVRNFGNGANTFNIDAVILCTSMQ